MFRQTQAQPKKKKEKIYKILSWLCVFIMFSKPYSTYPLQMMSVVVYYHDPEHCHPVNRTHGAHNTENWKSEKMDRRKYSESKTTSAPSWLLKEMLGGAFAQMYSNGCLIMSYSFLFKVKSHPHTSNALHISAVICFASDAFLVFWHTEKKNILPQLFFQSTFSFKSKGFLSRKLKENMNATKKKNKLDNGIWKRRWHRKIKHIAHAIHKCDVILIHCKWLMLS